MDTSPHPCTRVTCDTGEGIACPLPAALVRTREYSGPATLADLEADLALSDEENEKFQEERPPMQPRGHHWRQPQRCPYVQLPSLLPPSYATRNTPRTPAVSIHLWLPRRLSVRNLLHLTARLLLQTPTFLISLSSTIPHQRHPRLPHRHLSIRSTG